MRNLLFVSLMSVSAWAAIPAHPGMLNYVEGQARIDGQTVTSKSVGSSEVEQGQVLETGRGKAEILLTPGVFLRLGENSAARLDADGLTHTSVELLHGQAMVEADNVQSGNHIQVSEQGAATTIEKNGLYRFDADAKTVAVYDGKATVQEGDRHVDLKKGKETGLATLHADSFDRKKTDDLYAWSDLRSRYISEASGGASRTYVVDGGGWFWNPRYSFYSWLPGDGLFYNPFGYGYGYGFARGYGYGGYSGYRVIDRGAFVHSGDRSGSFGRSSAPAFHSTGVSAARASGFGGGGAHRR